MVSFSATLGLGERFHTLASQQSVLSTFAGLLWCMARVWQAVQTLVSQSAECASMHENDRGPAEELAGVCWSSDEQNCRREEQKCHRQKQTISGHTESVCGGGDCGFLHRLRNTAHVPPWAGSDLAERFEYCRDHRRDASIDYIIATDYPESGGMEPRRESVAVFKETAWRGVAGRGLCPGRQSGGCW